MNRTEAIFLLNRVEEEFRKAHMDTEADALALAVYTMGTVDELRKERDAAMAQQTCGDTISRQAAIDGLSKLKPRMIDTYEKDGDPFLKVRACDVNDMLEELPSAQHKTGRWIEQEEYWECSECKDQFVLEVGVTPKDARMFYCPVCGAKMETQP